jgi:tetratricopeptide (TPR) repeat protein
VVTQRALFEDAPIIETINSKFGFELNEGTESPFDASLFRDKASQSVFSQLSRSLQAKLNAVWAELLALAAFKSKDESPVIVSENLAEKTLDNVCRQIDNLAGDVLNYNCDRVETDDCFLQWQTDLNKIAEPAMMVSYLDKTSVIKIHAIAPSIWLTLIDNEFSLSGQVLLSSAKLLMRVKAFELAISYFQKAVSVGDWFPYVDMMIAQCKQALKQYKEAEFFFKKAIVGNPNNPIFYTNYAKLLVVLNRFEKAHQQFELGANKGVNQPACLVPYCDFLAKENNLEKAILIVEQFAKKISSL